LDNTNDTQFYQQPRFVTHIDDTAIAALTAFYGQEFMSLYQRNNNRALDVLDLCSSWISHLPEVNTTTSTSTAPFQYGRVVGLGMNRPELEANPQLSEFVVQDLNGAKDGPSLLAQFDDDSFDVICNVVSVDYLTQPLQVFQEMYRILRPGGIALISFSNRCFPTKAIAMWLQGDDIDRITIVASYFYYSYCSTDDDDTTTTTSSSSTRNWSSIEAWDLKERQELPSRPSVQDLLRNPSSGFAWMNSAAAVQRNNAGDPMYVVKGVK
jgi:SAM-dependent methyltransferase